MNKSEYLKIIRKEIKYVFDRDKVEKELSDHLQDSIYDLIEAGYSYEEAEQQAITQMGEPKELGQLLNKEHNPLFGYLYSFTQLIVCFLTVPLILYGISFVDNVTYLIFPITTEIYVEKIELDYEIDIAGHKIVLDYICIDEQGNHTLTYRSWIKWSYSRFGWNASIRGLKDLEGNPITCSSRDYGASSVGKCEYIEFELPENEIFIVEMPDEQIITIDLGDYQNE